MVLYVYPNGFYFRLVYKILQKMALTTCKTQFFQSQKLDGFINDNLDVQKSLVYTLDVS